MIIQLSTRPPTCKTMIINKKTYSLCVYIWSQRFQLKLITHGRAGYDGQHFEEISTHDSAMQIKYILGS